MLLLPQNLVFNTQYNREKGRVSFSLQVLAVSPNISDGDNSSPTLHNTNDLQKAAPVKLVQN